MSSNKLPNCRAARRYLFDYCQVTTIHGFKYIGEITRPWFERIFWMAAFTISTVGCALLIAEMINKLQTNPITVSLAERQSSIAEIPFPAVTICSDICTNPDFERLPKTKTNGNISIFQQLNDEDKARFQAISVICKPNSPNLSEPYIPSGKFVQILREISSYKWFERQSATWNNIYGVPFVQRLTPYGSCFSFNIIDFGDLLNAAEVHDDFIYDRNITLFKDHGNDSIKRRHHDMLKFPWNATLSDKAGGLRMELCRDNDTSELRCSVYSSFRLFIHGTNEFYSYENSFMLHSGEAVELMVKPKLIITDENLRGYSVERRNCFFRDERKLRFFNEYSQHNCELECFSNITLSRCGCVKLDIIRDRITKICNTTVEVECIEKVEDELYSTSDTAKSKLLSYCQCLPACTILKYEIEIAKTRFKSHDLLATAASSLKVFFKANDFVPLRRFQLYGIVDFLANCGGLLGLFVGVSVLSIVEIFYYFVVRLVCTSIRNHHRQTAISKMETSLEAHDEVRRASDKF